MKTTLNKIREHSPCTGGWEKLLTYLGKTKADDEPLSIATIIDSNGLDDAIWCLQAVEGYDKEISLYAVWCARKVQHLIKDQRSLDALDTAERYANGDATVEELNSARSAAKAARAAAAEAAAWAAARSAAANAATTTAAADAAEAAWAAASEAAWAAAWYATRAAAWIAADAAMATTMDAAWHAAARAKQEAELRRICEEG